MNTILVTHTTTRTLVLMPSISLVAIARAYAADGLMLRWRRVPQAQSNFGFERNRESKQ
ncbi:MAG: hypothetical protein KJN72_12255 [Woeseia sp.]|nr:hypothetical protein [Woeseia sp.]